MKIKLGRKTLGIICLIAAVAIIFSSAVLGQNAYYSPPFIPESIYFSNLDAYANKEVYITASISEISNNSITFTNQSGASIVAELQNPEEAKIGELIFLSITYNKLANSFSGKILYKYEDKALREGISILGLIIFIIYLGRTSKFNLRRLKLIAGDAKNA